MYHLLTQKLTNFEAKKQKSFTCIHINIKKEQIRNLKYTKIKDHGLV